MGNNLTEKQLLLAEHKKANDALRELKEIILDPGHRVIFEDGMECYYFSTYASLAKNVVVLSDYLRMQFEAIMKSNKSVKQSTFKPIKVKNLTREDRMKAKKKVTKKPTSKKPAKKMK